MFKSKFECILSLQLTSMNSVGLLSNLHKAKTSKAPGIVKKILQQKLRRRPHVISNLYLAINLEPAQSSKIRLIELPVVPTTAKAAIVVIKNLKDVNFKYFNARLYVPIIIRRVQADNDLSTYVYCTESVRRLCAFPRSDFSRPICCLNWFVRSFLT